MIKSLRRIRNLDIFSDYSWGGTLPGFTKCNIFYGYNGSGKTTLTRLFAAMSTGTTDGFPGLEYTVETDEGTVTETQPCARKIRVFNEDYVSRTVNLIEGRTKPIFILGEESKQIAEEITTDEQLLLEKHRLIERAQVQLTTSEEQRGKLFTQIAKEIGGLASGHATRTYRKPDAEAAFAGLTQTVVLTEEEECEFKSTLQQQEKRTLEPLSLPLLAHPEDGTECDLPTFLRYACATAKDLCAHTVESMVIARLKENSDIAQWVEEGLALHLRHNSDACEYCRQRLPEQRQQELTRHFNDADKTLKDRIDRLIKRLLEAEGLLRGVAAPDEARIYDELQSTYQSSVTVFTATGITLQVAIASIISELKGKKLHTTEPLVLQSEIDVDPFMAALDAVNAVIESHNRKTHDFSDRRTTARMQLEKHYLSSIYDEVTTLDKLMAAYREEIKELLQGNPADPADLGITALEARIKANRAKLSDLHKGCAELNDKLHTFLGRNEIVFEVEAEGYTVKRGGRVAHRLSEGEKNAIAFVFFTVELRDRDFVSEDGIVVVDDPVSSLDSNSTYQAFSFLTHAVKHAHQVFLFTHNFGFLRFLLDWRKKHHREGRASFYMITNPYRDGRRIACIEKLDRLLQDHASEYQYLFKRLYTFAQDSDNHTLEFAYDMPNVARKVLETFLMFRVPGYGETGDKLERLTDYDPYKRTAIYKFANDLSHMTGDGFDPALMPETQKNVRYLLDMIEKEFPEHYRILVQSLNS